MAVFVVGGEWREWDSEDDLLLLVGQDGEERGIKAEPSEASGRHG